MIMSLRTLAKRSKRLAPLLAVPAALLLSQGEAKAILTYYIFENAGNVEVQAVGSLILPISSDSVSSVCDDDGYISSSTAAICTGNDLLNSSKYKVLGPISFNGTVNVYPADSVTGIPTILDGVGSQFFWIDTGYTPGTSVTSTATFNTKTLASIGFTTTGLLGTWTLQPKDGSDPYTAFDTIQVVIGAPPSPSTAVPGPLPLLGAGAAFGWSRRLRKRIAAPLTPPQA
jgi:MYXO-CTERM domain-containing protein